MDCLLDAVRAIERLSENERRAAMATTGAAAGAPGDTVTEELPPLGADDLFPIFVYVLVQSDLWKGGGVIHLRELLSGLANPERQRWSASAYYVATLEAAIEHIKAT